MERGGYGRRRVLKSASWNRKTRGGERECRHGKKKRPRAGESARKAEKERNNPKREEEAR